MKPPQAAKAGRRTTTGRPSFPRQKKLRARRLSQLRLQPLNFFDRHNKFARSVPAGAASATGFFDLIRLRRRYEVIVAGNRNLFQNARVLDVMSGPGFWTLAALDAGAAHVVGVEPAAALVEFGQ